MGSFHFAKIFLLHGKKIRARFCPQPPAHVEWESFSLAFVSWFAFAQRFAFAIRPGTGRLPDAERRINKPVGIVTDCRWLVSNGVRAQVAFVHNTTTQEDTTMENTTRVRSEE